MAQTAVEKLFEQVCNLDWKNLTGDEKLQLFEQAKQMEKEHHSKFNKFLENEMDLEISDVNTIKRVQWYYNTYFNETYKK